MQKVTNPFGRQSQTNHMIHITDLLEVKAVRVVRNYETCRVVV